MRDQFQHTALFFALLFLTLQNGCSRLQDDEFSSTNPDLAENSLTLEFSAEVNTTSYQSITFSNNSTSDYYEIFNIAKANDVCAAFSRYNITDLDNDVLYDAKQSTETATSDQIYSLAVAIAPGDSVKVNIEFSPIACEQKEYSPTMVIYYTTSTTTESQSIIMYASVLDNSTTNTCGEPYQAVSMDDILGEEPSRLMPALPAGQYYAVVPYAFRGYIQPTEGFASLAAEIYAYFDNPAVPSPGYLPPYLPLEYVEDGLLKFSQIDACRGLEFPTSITDSYFLGALQTISTNQDYDFVIETEDPDNLGAITVESITLALDSNINNSSSILQSEDGNFAIQFETTLTTGYTTTNNYLQNSIGKIFDDEGNDILRIEDNGDESRMYGSPLRHGELILVGVGSFVPTGYIMSDEATSGLIDTPAYLFIQIHARIVVLNESDIPIESIKAGEWKI